jgi:hypothetical protein
MGATIKKTNSIFFNHSFDKKRLKRLISWVFKKSGEAEALKVLDLLKQTGFQYATKAGISIGLHDLTTPLQKSWLISESQLSMNTTDRDFIGAKITATERSQRIIDTWHRASESLSKQVVDYFGIYDQFNPVYIMALSGARGNFSQVRQLIGMRGLMADQQGKIVNFPIRSNLREGLTLTEYFISCSGARKGLVDTALRTADTGYLTRRLVDVSHHVVVKRIRCNTNRGIAFKSLQSYNKVLLPLKERLVGRVLAEDIETPFYESEPQKIRSCLQDKKNNNLQITSTNKKYERSQQLVNKTNGNLKLIAKKDQEISSKLSSKISQVRNSVFIRSPLTCEFTHSVCQLCYGWSISQGSLVSLGDAVGVIAAQSIGEPGTQLTMRTFHTGGVFSGDLLQEIRAPHSGEIRFSKAFQGLLIRSAHGRIAFLSKTQGYLVLTNNHHFQISTKPSNTTVKKNNNSTEIPIQAFTMLFVRQGEKVEKNQLLAEFSIQNKEGNQPIKTQQTIFADVSGRVIEDSSGTVYTKSIKESILLLQHSFQETSHKNNINQKRLNNFKKSCCFEHLSPDATKIKQNVNKTNTILQQSIGPYTCQSTPKGTGGFATKIGRTPLLTSPCPHLPLLAVPRRGKEGHGTAGSFATKIGKVLCQSTLPIVNWHGVLRRRRTPIVDWQSTCVTPLHTRKCDASSCSAVPLFAPSGHGKKGQKGARRAPFYPRKTLQGTAKRGIVRHGTAKKRSYHLPKTIVSYRMKKKICRFYSSHTLWKQKRHNKYIARRMFFGVPEKSKQGKVKETRASLLRKSIKTKKKETSKTSLKKIFNCITNKACTINQISSSFKREDLENDVFKYIEPVKSGRLGFLKILSTRVGATLDYTCPIKPFDHNFIKRKKMQKINVRRPSYVFEGFFSRVPEKLGSKRFTLSLPCFAPEAHAVPLFAPEGHGKKGQEGASVLATKTDGFVHKDYLSKKNKMQSKIVDVSTHFKVKSEVDQFSDAKTEMCEMSHKNKIERKNNKLCFLKNQLNYLHPEYRKENRFFLQSIAGYGDIVDEAYKII